MATHSSILAWRIPWTEETGSLQYIGSQLDMTEQLTPSLSLPYNTMLCCAKLLQWCNAMSAGIKYHHYFFFFFMEKIM